MSQVTLRRTFFHISILQIAIIVLAVATALIHLQLGISMSSVAGHAAGGHFSGPPSGGTAGSPPSGGTAGSPPSGGAGGRSGGAPGGSSLMSALPVSLGTLFYLNFAGYIVLVVALYFLPFLRRYQPIIRWLLIAYAAVTIVAWYLFTGGHANLMSEIDKPVEVLLILLLLVDFWQSRRARVKEAS